MDAAAEESPRRWPWVVPFVDGETEQPANAVSKVLCDDNLLRKIIVRVGFPTTLVRAALVCKRWLRHAANPAFLSRFRKLHPPSLLGYYFSEWSVSSKNLGAPPFHLMLPQPLLQESFGHAPITIHLSSPRFVPMLPQPPELSTVIRHLADYRFGVHDDTLLIKHCHNGTIFTQHDKGETELTLGVHRPLCPERGMPIVPPFPCVERNLQWFGAMLSKEGSNGGLSYLYVLGTKDLGKFLVHVYVLQDGVWSLNTSATCQPCLIHWEPKVVLVDNKIYIPARNNDNIFVLDLMTSTFSTIQLPQGVSYNYFRTMLSPADDASGVYLIHVNGFELRIWLSKGNSWLLVDTICLNMLDHTLEDDHNANVRISQVENNAEFVFLRMGGCTLYLDVTSKTLRKLHERTENGRHFSDTKPFMMIWPPIFPVLKDDPARDAM
ncbi:uncharacterized protein LOC119318898 [Triticum dicoccoides]|uniref:uncharacterized protein LOC119318898 n=1 Tax=Triticum dicoccoides TaxID=85692 RepID=UPI000E786D8C|nr:uncharacterized protein LOC119318898 [Triticum dicoccoides]